MLYGVCWAFLLLLAVLQEFCVVGVVVVLDVVLYYIVLY